MYLNIHRTRGEAGSTFGLCFNQKCNEKWFPLNVVTTAPRTVIKHTSKTQIKVIDTKRKAQSAQSRTKVFGLIVQLICLEITVHDLVSNCNLHNHAMCF